MKDIMMIVTRSARSIPGCSIVFISPVEAFIAHVSLTIYLSLFISSPYILYQIWAFVSIALTEREKRFISLYFPVSSVLFCAGALFGYTVIVPMGLRFLIGFAADSMTPMLTVSRYISFVGMLTIAFGVIFQVPLVMVCLTGTGIAEPDLFTSKRKTVIVLIFIAAALLTPPDVVTQLLMAVPLLLLYETGVICSRIVHNRQK